MPIWKCPRLTCLAKVCGFRDGEFGGSGRLCDDVAANEFGKATIAVPDPKVLNSAVVDRVRGEQHAIVMSVNNRPDLEVGRCDRFTINDEATGTISVCCGHDVVKPDSNGCARNKFNPVLILVVPDSGG